MEYKKDGNEYSETTNRKVFNRIHINCVTGCCLKCAKRQRKGHYGGFGENIKFPNWKLVSKNKKQWMSKHLLIEEREVNWNKKTYTTIRW